jgi:uncharacterized protein with von Willebrand factor type A (vWA) domain
MPVDQSPYNRVDALPRGLRHAALTTSAGRTAERLDGLPRWQAALEAGVLPPADADFGDAAAVGALRAVVHSAGLPAAARGRAGHVESALAAVLWHLDRIVDLQPRLDRPAAIAQVADELAVEWARERGDWAEALALLPDLGDLTPRQWDRLRGRLRSRAWQEAQRVQQHLARRPEIVALVRALGRAQRTAAAPPAQNAPSPPTPLARAGRRVVETRLPGLPGELRGIRLSGRLEGMLGSEAAMLRHPVLQRLWRARLAEARLLAYDSEAVLHDWRPDPTGPPAAAPPPTAREACERGPILLCLDTSASMRGAPETLAKAVALEALRTAHRERRGCLLIAFGGDGEVATHALGVTDDGLDTLLDLMGRSFDGGTDLQTPIERAVATVERSDWRDADLLLVSDGEFGCTPATLERLDAARTRTGLRVQGVLVGDRETMGLLEVCDAIHWVRDWRRDSAPESAAAGAATSPVHSKSLTALYFPNALSARAARHLDPQGAGAGAAAPRRPADVDARRGLDGDRSPAPRQPPR